MAKRNDERFIVGSDKDEKEYDHAHVTKGELHTKAKITDENNEPLKGQDLRNIEIKNALEGILAELKKVNIHLSVITDEDIIVEED